MKPGNLQCKVPNPAATRDEDSILRTSNARCAVFYFGSFLKNICHCEPVRTLAWQSQRGLRIVRKLNV